MKTSFFIYFASVICAASLMTGCKTESLERPEPVPEQDVVLEDAAFMQHCLDNYDYNGDGKITNYELGIVVDLSIPGKGIRSLSGIEYFTKLRRLDCSGNELGQLSLTNNTLLTELKCGNCSLTSLDITGCERLIVLHCSDNPGLPPQLDLRLTPRLEELICSRTAVNDFLWESDSTLVLKKLVMDGIPAPNNTRDFKIFRNLTDLSLRDNRLSSMVTDSLENLKRLDISDNNFTGDLTIGPLPVLSYLQFTGMSVTSFTGISNYSSLDTLVCSNNNLSSLDLSSNSRLKRVECSNNHLSNEGLVVNRGASLEYLDCSQNQLTGLDVSNNTGMRYFNCSGNLIDRLDVSNITGLGTLLCNSNNLKDSIDISRNRSLTYLDCTNNPQVEGVVFRILVWEGFDASKGTYLKDETARFEEQPEEEEEQEEQE